MSDNFFLNQYKKKNNNPPDNNPKPFAFEKIPENIPVTEKKPVSKKRLAALFLILSGIDRAKEILKTFSEDELVKIVGEITQIDVITDEEIREVEKSFGKVPKQEKELQGGKNFVRELLQKAFGITKGSEFFVKILETKADTGLAFLDPLTAEQIKNLIADESESIIALILGSIDPKKSAKIIGLLPKETSIPVIRKLSEKIEISSDIMDLIIKKLKEKASKVAEQDTVKIAGKNKLIDILKYSSQDESDFILNNLENYNQELAEEIKEKLFTWNDIPQLSRKDLEKALKLWPDREVAWILKGAKEEYKNLFFLCMSKRRKDVIIDEISLLGEVRKSEVDDKRKEFIDFLKNLESSGQITLLPDKEIYIK